MTKELQALKRRVNKARKVPQNTYPAARIVADMADSFARDKLVSMFNVAPDKAATALYGVLLDLWTLRAEEQQRLDALAGNVTSPRGKNPRKVRITEIKE